MDKSKLLQCEHSNHIEGIPRGWYFSNQILSVSTPYVGLLPASDMVKVPTSPVNVGISRTIQAPA